jgi:hypothetical protein
MTKMGDNKFPNQPKLSNPEDKSGLSDEQVDKATGGASLSYEKVGVVYKPQKPDGTASIKGGDPDEGGQIRLR